MLLVALIQGDLVCLGLRATLKARNGPAGVVGGHPIFDDTTGMEPVIGFFEAIGFLFQIAPQPIDGGVIKIGGDEVGY